MCRVVNKFKEPYDVYIGRGSLWGNPFVIGRDGTREDVIDKYTKYLWRELKNGRITKEMLISLDGKVLGCYCKPKSCHGDIIKKAVNWVKKETVYEE